MSTGETLMETEDLLPKPIVDLLNEKSSEITETSVNYDTVKPTTTNIDREIVEAENIENSKFPITEKVTKDTVYEITEDKVEIPINKDNIPKNCVSDKDSLSCKQEKKVLSEEVFTSRTTPIKEVIAPVLVTEENSLRERKLVKDSIKEQEVVLQKEVVNIPEVISEKETIKLKPESKLKEIIQATQACPIQKEATKEKSPTCEVINLPSKAPTLDYRLNNKTPNLEHSTVVVKDHDVEMLAVQENLQSDAKKEKLVEAAKPESQTVNGDIDKVFFYFLSKMWNFFEA